MRTRLSVLMFLMYAAPGAWWPLLTLHLEALRFSYEEIALCYAAGAMAQLFAPLVAGQVADRWLPAQHCAAVCAAVGAAILWFLPALDDFPTVFWACLGFWAVMVPALTLGVSICFAHLPDPPRHYGGCRMWGTIGWAVAGLALWCWLQNFGELAWLREWLRPADPRARLDDAFRLGCLLALVLAAYNLMLPHTPPTRRQPGNPGAVAWLAPLAALRLMRDRAFMVYCVCALGVCATLPFSIQVTPRLLVDLGVAVEDVPSRLPIAQTAEIVSLGLLPVILLRLGVRGTMLLGLGSWCVAMSVQAFAPSLELVTASLALNGLCICCFLVAGQVYVNGRARGDVRASSQALLSFINGLGLLGGSLLVGAVRAGFAGATGPTFATAAGVAFVSLLIFLLGFPSEPSAAAVPPVPAGELVPSRKMG